MSEVVPRTVLWKSVLLELLNSLISERSIQISRDNKIIYAT